MIRSITIANPIAALASAPASAGFFDAFIFGNADMGGYDGDSRRSSKLIGSVLGSAMDAMNEGGEERYYGGGHADVWSGHGGDAMEAFGMTSHVSHNASNFKGGAGQDSADVFKKTEGGSGIYHAGNEIPRSIELPTGGGDTPGKKPIDLGGGSDSGGTGGYKGGDGGVYASAQEAAAHGGNYGYRASTSVGAAHSSVSGHGNSAMDFMNGFF